jgi:hypothetical protein
MKNAHSPALIVSSGNRGINNQTIVHAIMIGPTIASFSIGFIQPPFG